MYSRAPCPNLASRPSAPCHPPPPCAPMLQHKRGRACATGSEQRPCSYSSVLGPWVCLPGLPLHIERWLGSPRPTPDDYLFPG